MVWPSYVCAQNNNDSLPVVELNAALPVNVATSTTPVQQLNKKQLDALNAISVADAAKFFSGVLVKDYGGLGGLKTISVRSLGAQHTAVMYDGMVWNDAQNGQTDLGKLSLQNLERMTLYQMQPDIILLPARAMAAGSVLMLQSSGNEKRITQRNAQLSFKTGSFGLINPAGSVRLSNKKWLHQISGEWQKAHGAYRFPSIENFGEKDKRLNTEMENGRVEYDLMFHANDSNKLHFKTYYYASARALPGAIVLNNTSADDQLNDRHFLIQGSWKKHIHGKTAFWLNAKYHHLFSGYTDPTFNNPQGKLENRFHQNEYYVSGAFTHTLRPFLSVGWSSDFFINNLLRTDSFAFNFQPVNRSTWLNAFTLRYTKSRVMANAGIVHTYQTNKERNATNNNILKSFNPFAGVNIQPIANLPLHIRLSYKEIFRTPSFNDLYYTLIGNTALKPEEVQQMNVGITYKHTLNRRVQEVLFTVDAYSNRITNKIQAVPRQNLFQWSMMNIGKVQVNGIDVSALIRTEPFPKWSVTLNGAYTYQKAIDKTHPGTSGYKQQLPYTPEHSGSAGMMLQHKQFSLAYHLLFSGYRYRQGDQIPENYLEGWLNQDIKLSYQCNRKESMNFQVYAEVSNIGNVRYEIIKYYPMPGINYRLGIVVNFIQL